MLLSLPTPRLTAKRLEAREHSWRPRSRGQRVRFGITLSGPIPIVQEGNRDLWPKMMIFHWSVQNLLHDSILGTTVQRLVSRRHSSPRQFSNKRVGGCMGPSYPRAGVCAWLGDIRFDDVRFKASKKMQRSLSVRDGQKTRG